MWNPKIAHDSKFASDQMIRRATREGFGDVIVQLGEEMPNVVVLSADLTESTMCDKFAQKFPERFFEIGVAEQNLVAIASGLAVSGKIAFASSYAAFSPAKNYETIRTTIAYNEANVKIMGHHAGIVTGPDGATHQMLEDIALMSILPGMRVLCPCDAIEAGKAVMYAATHNGPCYIRFSREKTEQVTSALTPFSSVPTVFWEGDQVELVIFATGHLLSQVLLAVVKDPSIGKRCRVVNITQIKPLPSELILDLSKDVNMVMSVEDHQKMGGLGSMLAQIFAKNQCKKMEFVAVEDQWGQSGSAKDLLSHYGLDSASIARKIESMLDLSSEF